MREGFRQRAVRLSGIRTLTFETNLGPLMACAAGVVAMGGYNTFCEILSFDKKALIVPRTRPRLEQFIRAQSARQQKLAEMLPDDGRRDPATMATAPSQNSNCQDRCGYVLTPRLLTRTLLLPVGCRAEAPTTSGPHALQAPTRHSASVTVNRELR